MLREFSQDETEASISAKLGRGTFSAEFFVTVLLAIGAKEIRLTDI